MTKHTPKILLALASIALVLLAVVDLRRGFLFSEHLYIFKSPFLFFSPYQLLLFIPGVLGLRLLRPALQLLSQEENKRLLTGILLLLILDFVIYRGVAMEKSYQLKKVSLHWMMAFGETGISKPLYLSLSYFLTVWHATFLSCLLGGWAALAFPHISKKLTQLSTRNSGFLGAAFSLTQPLCSCCVAITAPSLLKRSIPKSFAISVLIGAPMLNISTLILAGTLLPWPFSLIRIFGGLLVTVGIGYVLGSFFRDTIESDSCELPSVNSSHVADHLIKDWFKQSGRLILWLFPSIVIGVFLTSFIWQFWPQSFLNSWQSTAIVSLLGSILMISTWSEIPLALQMIEHGLTGPAATALIALPAVNLASLLLIGKSTKEWKLVFCLGLSVVLVSFLIGICLL